MPKRIEKLVYKDGEATWVPQVKIPVHCKAKWPIISDSAGVHPLQLEEVREGARARGVPTEFTDDGSPVFTSLEHRRRYMKIQQMHDRSGYD